MITFEGKEKDWDLIWETIRMDMESKAFDPELREQLKAAYNRIMDVNYPGRTAPLTLEQIEVGKTYRIRAVKSTKRTLHNKLIRVEEKHEDNFLNITCTLLQPVRNFRIVQKVLLEHWMLEEEAKENE